jgi:uncharacterized protein YecE (DUF72 family)
MIYVGVAGWAVPKQYAHEFPPEGSQLQRYAARYNSVEINSSFYTPHRPATYARWRDAVPDGFRFSAKLPREITHKRMLVESIDLLDEFLRAITQLRPKLGPLLVQLPPRLEYDAGSGAGFLQSLRRRFEGSIVLEPRHPAWFAPEPERLLRDLAIARVAADPPPVPGAELPGGSEALRYYRLHGSPDMYYSTYSDTYLNDLSHTLRSSGAAETWCIFDNTARQYATVNSIRLLELLSQR